MKLDANLLVRSGPGDGVELDMIYQIIYVIAEYVDCGQQRDSFAY